MFFIYFSIWSWRIFFSFFFVWLNQSACFKKKKKKIGANKTKCTFVNFCISFDVLMLIVFWKDCVSGAVFSPVTAVYLYKTFLCWHHFSLNPAHLCRGSTAELFHTPAVFDIRPWNYKCFIKVGIFLFFVGGFVSLSSIFFYFLILLLFFEYLKSSGTQHAVPNCLVICEYFE